MLTEEDFYDLRRRHQRRRLDGTYRDNPQLNLDIDILIDIVEQMKTTILRQEYDEIVNQNKTAAPDDFEPVVKHFQDF